MSASVPAADLLPRLRELATRDGALVPGEGLVIGLSGGADSVALLELLARLREEWGLRLLAAHVDHGLRPESAGDAEFCRALCADLHIDCVARTVDVAEQARASGMGIEATGRRIRYAFFEQLRVEHGLDRVATAHHRDDQLETLLLWLFRGSGLSGLRGIRPAEGRLVRPLWGFSRAEIRAHLSERGLEFREDSSNQDPGHLRNRLRKQLLPTIEAVFDPGAGDRLLDFARRAEAELEALEELGRAALEACRTRQEPRAAEAGVVTLRRALWNQQHKALQFHALRHLIGDLFVQAGSQRWGESNWSEILEFMSGGQTGKQRPLPGGGRVELERDVIRFTALAGESAADPAPETVPSSKHYRLQERLLPVSDAVLTMNPDTSACFDADRVHPPLRLRSHEPGDRMRPFGMTGRKKLADLYREHGVPAGRRSAMLVVEDSRDIIWAVGITTAETTRIRPSSKTVLEVTLEPCPAFPRT